MSIITEIHTIKAHLLVQGTSYPMLDIVPHKHNELHFLLREYAFQFLVVIGEFARNIIVGRQSFAILPCLEPYNLEVSFLVEDVERKEAKQLTKL